MNIRQLASLLDLSPGAVSRALHDDPAIPLSTRLRVKAMADKKGYIPNPTVANTMGYIARKKTAAATSPIMLLSEWEQPEVNAPRLFQGAKTRATQLGYRIEVFWTRAPRLTSQRISSILFHRGIRGVVVVNYIKAPATLTFDLTNYACAVIGRALTSPRIVSVDHDHHQGLFETLVRVAERGYKKPALALTVDAHERTMHCWAAAYQLYSSSLPLRARIPVYLESDGERAFASWIRKYQPDVVIANDSSFYPIIQRAGFNPPQDFGLTYLYWRHIQQGVAGVDIMDETIGAKAVDIVVEQLRRNSSGQAERPCTILFDGIWRDGPSLPPLTGKKET